MHKVLRVVGILVLVGGLGAHLSGCPRTSSARFEKAWWGRRLLERRASFDLRCPPSQLRYVPLGPELDPYSVVGVTGCGRRGVYRFQDGSWVPDVGVRQTQGD